jgi:hypothetical protein
MLQCPQSMMRSLLPHHHLPVSEAEPARMSAKHAGGYRRRADFALLQG